MSFINHVDSYFEHFPPMRADHFTKWGLCNNTVIWSFGKSPLPPAMSTWFMNDACVYWLLFIQWLDSPTFWKPFSYPPFLYPRDLWMSHCPKSKNNIRIANKPFFRMTEIKIAITTLSESKFLSYLVYLTNEYSSTYWIFQWDSFTK